MECNLRFATISKVVREAEEDDVVVVVVKGVTGTIVIVEFQIADSLQFAFINTAHLKK